MRDINKDDKRTVDAKCPQCGHLMADMGLDFESPKQKDVKAWEHIKNLYSVGITFHSCGCTGPGYIPNTSERLAQYFKDLLKEYQLNLVFWRQRIEPTNEKEIQREKSKHFDFVRKIPRDLKNKRGVISNEEAKNFWFNRIKEVESKLAALSME